MAIRINGNEVAIPDDPRVSWPICCESSFT